MVAPLPGVLIIVPPSGFPVSGRDLRAGADAPSSRRSLVTVLEISWAVWAWGSRFMNCAAAIQRLVTISCKASPPERLRPHLKVPLEKQRLLLVTRRVSATSCAGLGAFRARPQPFAWAVESRLRVVKAVWPAHPAGRRQRSPWEERG